MLKHDMRNHSTILLHYYRQTQTGDIASENISIVVKITCIENIIFVESPITTLKLFCCFSRKFSFCFPLFPCLIRSKNPF